MAYKKRIPPNKLKFSIEDYNKLVEMLNIQSNCIDENINTKSNKLKDKVLRYSVPVKEDNEEIILDVRFFNSEMVDFIYVVFELFKDKIETTANYYEVLMKVRENIKEEKTKQNE